MRYRISKIESGVYAAVVTAAIVTFVSGEALAMPWSWDMFSQPSHKAQEEAAYPMPKDSVPAKGKFVFGVKTKENSMNLPNPVPPTDESLARGKALYNIYCVICHGETGHGDGKLGKKYMTPADLTSDYIKKVPDGSIYFTITYGGLGKDEQMPAQGEAISPEDRWNIVNFTKHVLSWW
ncbi:MAG: cytochrome c [Deltaproteobacteria bacterium]|nr:cytochrome c [Deltaproteobacteria bacterium]